LHPEGMYPRTLVINADAIHQGSGTGITVANLFGGWPPDRLAQLYLNRGEIRGDAGCARTWRLEFVKDRVPGWRLVQKCWLPGGKRIPPASPDPGARGPAIPRLRGTVRTLLDPVPYRLSPDLLGEIRAFAPEAIYSCIGNMQLASLVDRLSRREGAATVVHLMDDWLATKHTDSWIWGWHRYRLVRLSSDLLRRATACLAISSQMAQEYAKVFGRPFGVFMNCVALNGADEPAPPAPHPDEPVRFVYVGGLHLGRWQSLVEIGEALEGMEGRLILHAPAADLDAYARGVGLPRSMEIGNPLPPDEVRPVLRQADVAVHVESFGGAERRYTRLSVSTKIPQYMAAGRPILAYGPGDVASCQYVSAAGCGVVVGRRDRRDLTGGLCRLSTDAGLRAELGRQAWCTALRHHHAETVRERFRLVVADAARTRRAGAGETAAAG